MKAARKEGILVEVLTTRELTEYLNVQQFTICKYAAKGLIPAIRIGKVWRFDKEAVDAWICSSQKKHNVVDNSRRKARL